jgi:hypothetical protein
LHKLYVKASGGAVVPLAELVKTGGTADQALDVIVALLRIAEIEHGRRYAGFGQMDLGQVGFPPAGFARLRGACQTRLP